MPLLNKRCCVPPTSSGCASLARRSEPAFAPTGGSLPSASVPRGGAFFRRSDVGPTWYPCPPVSLSPPQSSSLVYSPSRAFERKPPTASAATIAFFPADQPFFVVTAPVPQVEIVENGGPAGAGRWRPSGGLTIRPRRDGGTASRL